MKRWKQHCVEKGIDWRKPPVASVINYLAQLQDEGASYSKVNVMRSAISAVATMPNGSSLGEHPLVKRLLRGVYNKAPPVPRYSVVWDVNTVLEFLKERPGLGSWSVKELTLNTVTLLLVLSGQRCQTVASLSRCVQFGDGRVRLKITGLLKTARPGARATELILKAFPSEANLCIVTLLREYVARTDSLREASEGEALFRSYQKPFKTVGASTIGRWTKETLGVAGVDISMFKAHSTRAAATSAAKTMIPVDQILKCVGWSSATTFGKFYDKPLMPSKTLGEAVLERFNNQ